MLECNQNYIIRLKQQERYPQNNTIAPKMIRGILYDRLLADNLVMSISIEMNISQFTVFKTSFDVKQFLQTTWNGTVDGTVESSETWTVARTGTVAGSWSVFWTEVWTVAVAWTVAVSVGPFVFEGMSIIMSVPAIFELWQFNTDNNIIVYKPFNFC